MPPPNPNQATGQNQQLDPTVVNLAKAIRTVESGGNFQAKGKSGEFGAYQYTPDTWKGDATEFLGSDIPLEAATPQQQNEVAYKKLAKLKGQGYNVGQIASIWNSGKPDWQGNVGTNSKGVAFDTPQYVNTVSKTYQSYKTGKNPSSIPNTSSTAPDATPQPKEVDTYGATFPASPDDNPLEAGAKAVGNLPSSVWNLAKGVGTAIAHPIKTLEGLGNAAVGGIQEGYHALKGDKAEVNDQTKTFDTLVGTLKDRYGSLENLQRTATNDPFGFGTDVLTLLEGGAAGLDAVSGASKANKAAEAARAAGTVSGEGFTMKPNIPDVPTASGALNNTIDTVGGAVMKPVQKAAGAVGTFASDALGKTLGVEGGAVRNAVQSSVAGGDAYKSFVEGLKGNVSPDELVSQARDAMGEVVKNRSSQYQDMLKTLGADDSKLDISPIYSELDSQLEKMGVKQGENGTLDFSRSRFALDTSAQKDIQTLRDYVKSYGSKAGDRTALGVDNLKKVIGGYYSPNSDYRALTQAIKSKTRDVLGNVKGYNESMKSYADLSDQIEDVQKGLSLGDKAAVETSFKKLTGAFKQNNEFRKQLIQELDQATGGQLLSKIAGQQMSSLMPRGLIGTLEAGGGIASVLTGGTGLLPLIGTAMVTSPKIVGTFIRGLGLGAQGTKTVMDFLGKFVTPTQAVVGANAVNRLAPPPPPMMR